MRAACLLLLVSLMAACGGGAATPEPEPAAVEVTEAPAPSSDVPVGTRVGERAPNFELPLLSGGEGRIALADLRGKVVLLTFWASWCGPCRMEVPALEKHWKAIKDQDAVILGVSIDDTEPGARSFLKMFPVTYPMAHDAGGGTVADAWGVSSIPATILIGADGVVRDRHLGYSPSMLANTMREISALLQE